MHYLL